MAASEAADHGAVDAGRVRASAADIYERVKREAAGELDRPVAALAFSGLFAGASVRFGATVCWKSSGPAVWTLDGILSWSTTPGVGFAVVASAGAGAAAAGAATARPEGLGAGAGRAGGATGVVAMT